MDNPNNLASPRKRLKVQHLVENRNMDGAPDSPTKSMAEAGPAQDESATHLDKEAECGITEFVDRGKPGFSAILKKRYTDFLVNEILPSGEVVHLTDLKARAKKGAKQVQQSSVKAAVPAEQAPDGPSTAFRPSEPSSNQTEDVPRRILAEPDPVKRQKHRVFVKQTEEGIEEIDKKETIEPLQQDGATEDRQAAAKENHVPSQPAEADTNEAENPVSSPLKVHTPSTANDWQAYAGKQTDKADAPELSAEHRETLASYFKPETIDGILALYDRIINSPHRRSKDYGSVKTEAIIDRAMRTSIHQDLRRIFQSRLESATDEDGAMIITAASQTPNWHARTPNNHNSNARKSQPIKNQWRDLGGDYLHFTLYKENKDTMEAISFLARQLKLQPRCFQFAGTKDRRGITVQRISAYRVLADRMVHAGKTLRNAKSGNYEYQPRELSLGDLTGNEFVITLRDCDFGPNITAAKATELVEAAVSSFRTKGFLNYYGLQRFGTFATRTDTIGLKMLQGDFGGAVDAILDFNPALLVPGEDQPIYDRIAQDDKARASALNAFQSTGKAHPAVDDLPRKFSAEAAIIRHLSSGNQENDFQGALNSIPRNLRLMYVHAYQSLVWNVVASERWKKYGSEVIAGDLVLIHEHAAKAPTTTQPEIDADGEPIVYPSTNDRAYSADDAFVRARALSKEEAASGNYNIFDIVLPTPGFDVLYPENDMAAAYKVFMASDRGGGLDPYDMRRKWKDISLSGSYRKMMARPVGGEVEYEVKAYTKEDEQFVKTDLDRLKKKDKAPGNQEQVMENNEHGETNAVVDNDHEQAEAQAATHTAADEALKEQQEITTGEKLAVILKLQLGSSQYATMALRELLGPGGLQAYKPDFGVGR